MTINSPSFLQPTIGSKLSSLSEMGQNLLVRDWRFQELESAIYHPNLTAALNRVWNTWIAEINNSRSEFSVLRKTPVYIHEFEEVDQNIDKALAAGGSIIMASPVLSNSCIYGPICIKARWASDKLVFVLKSQSSIFERNKKQKFYDLDSLIIAVLKTVDTDGELSSEYYPQTQGIAIL